MILLKTKNKAKWKIHGYTISWTTDKLETNIIANRVFIPGYKNISDYQNNTRIYLDEFPEQKELRESWLKK